MDKIFREQIAMNIDVCVEDMVVKSNSMMAHVQDL